MGRVVVVTSGKGGVGKTTSTAALGAALARTGQAVVVIDFDMGLRNLDLVMGAERRVVYDFVDVIQGAAKLPQALIRDKRIETLFLLPASQTRDKDALTEEGVARVIEELRPKFNWVICDSPAGIERGATLAMRHADAAVVVTNPEVSSVSDSHRIIGLLDAKTEKAEKGERIEKHLLLTRYDAGRAARGEMLTIEDVVEILSTPLLGVIPESEEVLRASNFGSPITISNPSSAIGRAYIDAARRLNGEAVEMIIPSDKKSLFNKLLGRTVSQQVQMKPCDTEAAARNLAGDARRTFISDRLSGSIAVAPAVNSQQQKMKDCNARAGEQKLTGEARRTFMSSCLKGT